MTILVTQVHTYGEVLCKLVAGIALDIPLVVHLELIVVADGGQRVIERTEGLILVLHGTVVLREERGRRIYYAVTQT